MPGPLDDVREWDEVTVTGTASSPNGHRFVALRGTVGAVSPAERNDDGRRYVKVWPADGQPDPDGSGKVWFREDGVESLVIDFAARGEE